MVIPYSQYREFCNEWNTKGLSRHLRFGQAFFNFAELHKMTPSDFLDKLYNAPQKEAIEMLEPFIDYSN